jgi:hypothetical protein
MFTWTFFGGLCGTCAQSLSAPFSYTLNICMHIYIHTYIDINTVKNCQLGENRTRISCWLDRHWNHLSWQFLTRPVALACKRGLLYLHSIAQHQILPGRSSILCVRLVNKRILFRLDGSSLNFQMFRNVGSSCKYDSIFFALHCSLIQLINVSSADKFLRSSLNISRKLQIKCVECKIWGSQRGDYEEFYLLGYSTI